MMYGRNITKDKTKWPVLTSVVQQEGI